MNKGIIFRIAIGENGFYCTLFNLFHFGLTSYKDPAFSTMLILGFWKLEVGLMLAQRYEKEVDMNTHGIS